MEQPLVHKHRGVTLNEELLRSNLDLGGHAIVRTWAQLAHDLEIDLEALFKAIRERDQLNLRELTYLSQHQADETVHQPMENPVAVEASTSGSSSSGDSSSGESSPGSTYGGLEEAREKISVSDFLSVLQGLVNKIYNQTNFQNNFKLFLGAVAWNLTYLRSTKEAYVMRCLYTGMAASAGVNAGILLTQGANQIGFNGRPYSELVKITGQLFFSVTLADGLWLPLADLGLKAGPVGSWFALPALFGLEAGLFAGAQYLMDKVTPKWKGQASFVPDINFTAKIAGAYFGFYALPAILKALVEMPEEGFGSQLLASMIAGLGTIVIPSILGRIDYVKARNVVSAEHLFK